jgi:hypothetical protein
MPSKRIRRLVRNFPENGLKVMLEDPRNVSDLLTLLNAKIHSRIDFEQMRVSPNRFIHRDYRHVEADVVLQAPLIDAQGQPFAKPITIYILIEHQSEPDEFMLFRVLEYVVLVFKKQLQDWRRARGTAAEFRFQPVLPVVLYSGTRTWKGLGQMVDLVAQGELVSEVTPSLRPLFLNLGQVSATGLARQGGAFGWLLRLIQQRKARTSVFQQSLEQAVAALEGMATQERQRWLEFLSYLYALVYHEREASEQASLLDRIETSVQSDPHRQEVFNMGKSIAETLIEQGQEKGRQEGAVRALQQALLRLLRKKFGKIPTGVTRRIEATQQVEQLEIWLDQFANARKLVEVGIAPLD